MGAEAPAVSDFGRAWRDGMAFNALVHSIDPRLVNLERVRQLPSRQRLENAFNAAESHLGIPKLLDPEGALSNSDHLRLASLSLSFSLVFTARATSSRARRVRHVRHVRAQTWTSSGLTRSRS